MSTTARFILTGEDRTAAAFRSVDRGLSNIGRGVRDVRRLFGLMGVALSGRALARWTSDAIKATQVTGEQARALREASTQWKMMHTEIQALATSIAVKLAPALENAGRFWRELFFPSDLAQTRGLLDEINQEITETAQKLIDVQEGRRRGMGPVVVERLERELAALRAERDALMATARSQQLHEAAARNAPRARDAYFAQLRGPPRSGTREYTPPSPDFPLNMQNFGDMQERQRMGDMFNTPALWQGEIGGFRGVNLVPDLSEVKEELDPIEEEFRRFSTSVGMSLHDSFVAALSGMEVSFGDVLRRMAADLITSTLFQAMSSMFSGGSFAANMFSAAGGGVPAMRDANRRGRGGP